MFLALHFHLTVDRDESDAQVAYMPMLDPGRDAQLRKVLPEYLTDEIVFERSQASLFYNRLLTFINRKD